MKRFLLLIILLTTLFGVGKMQAIPAYPHAVTVTQPDGSSVELIGHGDEFFHYLTTVDGYCVVQEDDGFYYYARLVGSNLVSTDIKVGASATRSAGAAVASRGVPKEIAMARAMERRKELSNNNRPRIGVMGTRSGGEVVTTKTLVILVEFADTTNGRPSKFQIASPKTSFSNLFNQNGYNYNDATGSVQDYYFENTNGHFRPTFDVYGPYTLPKTVEYYGANKDEETDVNLRQMIIDACTAADADVDFSQYSSGSYINDIFVVFAGYGEAESNQENDIWPCRWVVSSGERFDGKILYNFACSSELSGGDGTNMSAIGTFCHEFGHLVNLPDFYDFNYNGSSHPRYASLMGSGNYNNENRTPPALSATELNIIGQFLAKEDWATITTITEPKSYTLKPITESFTAYKLNTQNDGEYFLLETRSNKNKWDKYICGGTLTSNNTGLLVYHIDASQNKAYNNMSAADCWEYGYINLIPGHELYRIVEANSDNPADIASWFFPGRQNVTSLSDTNTLFRMWGKTENPYYLTNITKSGEEIGFQVNTKDKMSLYGTVKATVGTALKDASIFLIPDNTTQKLSIEGVNQKENTPVTRSVAGELYTKTDSHGNFSFIDVPVGKYRIIAAKDTYSDFYGSLTVDAALTGINIVLEHDKFSSSRIEKAWYDRLEYSASFYEDFILGSLIRHSDIIGEEDTDTYVLSSIKLFLDEGLRKVLVFKNDKKVYTKDVNISTPTLFYLDLSEADITVAKGDEVIIATELKTGQAITYQPLNVNDTTQRLNGTLVSTDEGKTWQQIKVSYDDNTQQRLIWPISGVFSKVSLPDGISFSKTTTTLPVGDYEKIEYTLQPKGAAEEIEWTSSAEDVALVDETGVIMAIGVGTAEISGTVNNKTAKIEVTVDKKEIESIATPVVNDNNATAAISWTPSTSSNQTSWNVRWKGTWDEDWHTKESDSQTALLDKILPNSTYEVQISGKRVYKPELYWGYSSTSFKTPDKAMVESLTFEQEEEILDLGETLQLNVIIQPADAWNKELIWESSDIRTATVSATGLVKALKIGSATITAKTKYGDMSASCKIIVSKGVIVQPYENSVMIKWESDDAESSWKLILTKGTSTVKEIVSSEKQFYIDGLTAGTNYSITISPMTSDTTESLSVSFTTEQTSAPYPYIKGIKGSYSSDEEIMLTTGGLSEKYTKVAWTIDGNSYTPTSPTTTLSVGQHKIVLKLTTKSGSTENIVKVITIN